MTQTAKAEDEDWIRAQVQPFTNQPIEIRGLEGQIASVVFRGVDEAMFIDMARVRLRDEVWFRRRLAEIFDAALKRELRAT
jgi:hypothetical protein